MKTCLYYWFIEPLRSKFEDMSESTPAFEVPIEFKSKSYKVALFVDGNRLPAYARLEIPRLNKKEIPEELFPMIQTVKEHLLSILRLTYHADANFFPRPVWTFVEGGTPYKIGLEFSEFTTQISFDPDWARRIFTGSFTHREEVRLLIDGMDRHIPLQYRYLSFYKILEHHFKKKGKWSNRGLEAAISPYESKFKEKDISKKPVSYIHALRDKCAHIKTGTKDLIGVTHLNHREALEVESILPILSKICIAIINRMAGGKFLIQESDNLGKRGLELQQLRAANLGRVGKFLDQVTSD